MVTRADWQWVPIGAVNNDVQDARAAVRVQDDCELISDAAGAHLDPSGEGVKTSRETVRNRKKRRYSKRVSR